MSNKNIIEGLKILNSYCEDGCDSIYLTHDTVWFTSVGDMKDEDIEKLIDLEWFQEGTIDEYQLDGGSDFKLKHFNPDEDWTYYV